MNKKILFCFNIFLQVNLNIFALDTITIAGTGSSQKLLQSLATQFEKDNPNTYINISNSIGSGGGIKSTAFYKSDLGRVARSLKKSEKKYNLNYMLLAYTPIVFVTNESVKELDNLNKEQIIDIYTGKIKRWESVGAKSGKIFVASREVGDASRDTIDLNFKRFASIKNPVGEILFSVPEILNVLTMYDNVIGYLPYSETIGTSLNVLSINNIIPSEKNIKEKVYPFYIPLAIVYTDNIKSLSKKFLLFLKTNKAKSLISENGAIPR